MSTDALSSNLFKKNKSQTFDFINSSSSASPAVSRPRRLGVVYGRRISDSNNSPENNASDPLAQVKTENIASPILASSNQPRPKLNPIIPGKDIFMGIQISKPKLKKRLINS